ncbi:sulfatase [Tamlana sp. 2_MG-2023]|uniref:sulfatase family protein n=1 Tax=unclassified Tamlana TaxID=2614803 RepID=UPI0026E43DD1|nr:MULTISPECIES: sulfatase [unclassified Tamlana]MDO6761262.1 sulfatase [Tamlana sp. 2_MG-2023]MDO6791745.1 sulfatase [Tamlana sp. 1_MG-2023]
MKYKILVLLIFIFSQTVLRAQQPNIVWITSEDNSKHYMKLFNEHGIETPNIESLAEQGIVFNNAFSNAAVCSAARSTLITSSYGPRLATHYHRAEGKIDLPKDLDMFPAYLKDIGYYTANNSKEDYNIYKSDYVWDDSSKQATWRNRKNGQPFFYVHNLNVTHEGSLHFSEADMKATKTSTKPERNFVQPNHPQTELFQYTNAFYRDKIKQMDGQVGAVIEQLKQDNLLENTIIFYFGDHGGVLPDSKGYLTEMGLEVPLVIYVPEHYKNLSPFTPGSKTNAFVSFIDFGVTVLNLAGIKTPKTMDGKPFLGENLSLKTIEKSDKTYSYADRFDEKYDMVRSYRKGKFKYVRNFEPFNIDGLMNNYRYKQLAYAEWFKLFKEGKLNEVQAQFFKPKPAEALYDIENDPYETKNLAQNSAYRSTLKSMRNTLIDWMLDQPDLSLYPEYYLINHAIQDPVAFGKAHKSEIKTYLNIANLALVDYAKAEHKLSKHLQATDDFERYWALIVCSSFGEKAKAFSVQIEQIMNNDPLVINKMRAAEFFGITGIKDTSKQLTHILYQAKEPTEALLILNTIVLVQDFYKHATFQINASKLNNNIKENDQVKRRLEYLNIN